MKRFNTFKMCLIPVFLFLFFLFASTKINAASAATLLQNSWGYKAMNFDDFLAKTKNQKSEEIIIAVLDTGIDINNPIFKNRILQISGKNYGFNCIGTCKQGNFMDEYGHGTKVASIIVGATHENVKILPIKLFGADGNGRVEYSAAAVEKVIALKKQGLNIVAINFSIYARNQSPGSKYNNIYKNAFIKAYNAGILSVVCAGNDSENIKNVGPANISQVIAVSSLSYNSGKIEFSSYSNYGTTIDFAAPGDGVCLATLNKTQVTCNAEGKSTSWGTSFAVPHVVAAIASIYTLNPDLPYDYVEKILRHSTIQLGTSLEKHKYGNGMIDMELVLKNTPYQIKQTITYPDNITLNGTPQFVTYNSSYKLMMTTNSKLVPEKVIIDGVALTKEQMNIFSQRTYMYLQKNENHTIEITYKYKTHSMSITVTGSGNVQVNNEVVRGLTNKTLQQNKEFKQGTYINLKFVLTNKNYTISKIVINGKSLSTFEIQKAMSFGYTITSLENNYKIVVEFRQLSALEILSNIIF